MTTTPVLEAVDETLETQGKPPLNVIYEWLTTVDHKKIGLMYIVYALIFLVIAGFEAILMRIQLAIPNNHFVSPQVFNQLFTMHGTTMVFFMGMPILFGMGNYLVRLMIGARDMAFPRLNAFSFWVSAFAGFLLYFSYIGGSGLYAAGSAPDVGWFAYAPLTSKVFSPGHSTDYWTLAVFLSGIGSIGTALNIVTTILCMRCKGMKMSRMPLLPWLYLVMSGLVFVAVSPLTAAQIMLTLDRYLGAHFFDTQAGGSAILWMHFFWIFGHPEVYVLVLPAFAFANEIIPVFSRKAMFGYPAMVAASVAIGFISLSVWAHHMFTAGLGPAGNTFFVFATMVISVPTGIKIFNWLATIWGGKIIFAVPMMFMIGFLFQFLIAGLTGIMLVRCPVQLAAQCLLLCRRSLPLCSGGSDRVLSLWGLLLLVSQSHRQDDGAIRSENGTSGYSSSASISPSTSCTSPASSACRDVSTPTKRVVAGIHLEPHCRRRSHLPSRRHPGSGLQHDPLLLQRQRGRPRSVGRLDP